MLQVATQKKEVINKKNIQTIFFMIRVADTDMCLLFGYFIHLVYCYSDTGWSHFEISYLNLMKNLNLT
jgi:hypothetical protein